MGGSAPATSYKEGYWGEIGAISLILPQFHTEILARRGVSRIFRRFGGGVIGTPVFFASTTAVVTLRARCASAAHPLRIHCASNHFEGLKPLYYYH